MFLNRVDQFWNADGLRKKRISLGVKAGFCVDTAVFRGRKSASITLFIPFDHVVFLRGFLAFLGGQQRDKPRSEQSED